MSPIKLRSDFDVELVGHAGDDEMICKAARVSTLGSASIESKESAGLINYLMRNRHGSPFEHAMLMFRISAPIVVWREFMRHRVGISYNEQSGRYMELEPVFYIPPAKRRLVQTGLPGQYLFEMGSREQYEKVLNELTFSYQASWSAYQAQLEVGVAREVARMCLPLSVYSNAYVTMNPRSLMHFLSLRTKDPTSMFPSDPMWEINEVANGMEDIFAEKFPTTHQAFVKAQRVAP